MLSVRKSFTIFFLLICFQITAIGGKIVYPWRATTAIVKAGESFEVWFNADEGQTVSSVLLNGPFNTVVTSAEINTGSWMYVEKSDWWNNWWGLAAFNFRYGNGRFMVINNGWHGFKPAEQIAEVQSWLQEGGRGNFRLGAAHIRNKEMAPFDSIANLNLVLIGHNHNIANQNPTPLNNKPIQYIVNSVRDHMEFNLFKVNEKKGVYTPVSGPTAQVVYVENPEDSKTPSLYWPKLRLSYAEPNDGSSLTNTAILVNNFDFPIEGASVRFIMPLGRKYRVSNGKVEQAFDGTSVRVVDVRVNLKPNSTSHVKIL